MKRTLALLAVVMLLISAASCAFASPVLSDNFLEETWVDGPIALDVDGVSVEAFVWNMTRSDNGGIDDKVVDALGNVSVFGGFGFQPNVAGTYSGTTLKIPLVAASAAKLPQSYSVGIAQQVLVPVLDENNEIIDYKYDNFVQVFTAASASCEVKTENPEVAILTLVLPQEYVIKGYTDESSYDSAIYWVYLIEGGSTPDTPDTPDTPAAPTVDIDGFVGQTEVTVSTEPEIKEGELEYLPLDATRADEVAGVLEFYGVAELTEYKTISVLTAIEVSGVVSGVAADVTFSDPCTVKAVLNPGITVPEGAELRVFLPPYGGDPADTPAANALTASVMPAETTAASAPDLLDFPAEYDAETSTVTFTTEGEVTIPGDGDMVSIPVIIAAVTKPAPAPSESGGSGGGGCSAGFGALALLAVVPLFAGRKK